MSYPGTKTPTKPTGVAKWQVPKRKTESCYGQSAEEWCKNVYEHTCELLRSRAEKLERVREQLKKY